MKRFVLIIIALATVVAAAAQPGRPRVAVVLSGGGAKGVAHISALRVIEEAGFPIDIVCGTSMGSLIGGLYSIGYDTYDLDSIVRAQDWAYLFSDRDDPEQQTLDQRRDHNVYALSRRLRVEPRYTATGGLIRGRNLATLFDRLCAGYLDSIDFASLPVTYACATTNIVDNTEVDFFSGRLPQAMRASMAIPGVFTPVRIGDKVLVDGGLRNNYPADLARKLGADIVIGVTVQGDLLTADELNDAVSIFGQIIDVNCKNKYDNNVRNSDIVVRVDVSGYSAASFFPSAIDTLLQRGETAARSHWDELLALRRRAGIDSTARADAPVSRAVSPWHYVHIADSLASRPLPAAVPVVHLGARFDTEESVALQLGFDAPLHTRIPVGVKASLRLGRRIMGHLEGQLFPEGKANPSLAYTFEHNDIDINRLGYRAYNVKFNHHRVEFAPITMNLRKMDLSLSARWDYYNYYGKILSSNISTFDISNSSYFSYRAELFFNSEDDWHLPSRGTRFRAAYMFLTDNLVTYNGGPALNDISAHWRMNIPVSRRISLQYLVYGRLLFADVVPLPLYSAVGTEWFGHYVEQQMPFAGVGGLELTDRHFVAAQIQARCRLGNNHHVLLRVAAAKQGDNIDGLLNSHLLLGSSAGYFYNSFIGPMGFTAGYSTLTRRPYFYINIGHEF